MYIGSVDNNNLYIGNVDTSYVNTGSVDMAKLTSSDNNCNMLQLTKPATSQN